MRELTLHKGAEQEELPLLLATINKARFLPADAGDDLLTLLWALEFENIKYRFIDFFSEGGGELPGPSGAAAGGTATAEERRARVAEEAAERAPERPHRSSTKSIPRSTSWMKTRSPISRGSWRRSTSATSGAAPSTCCST